MAGTSTQPAQARVGARPLIARWPTWALVAVSLGLAVANRFVTDDAFIYHRYAENLLAGHGLAWNPGYLIHGFSSLPWVLLVALSLLAGVEPFVVGLAFFALTLVLFAWSLQSIGESRPVSWLLLWLAGTNYTFSCFATGGLETPLHVAALVAAFYALLRIVLHDRRGRLDLAVLSSLLGAAFWVRMDSALPIVAMMAAAGLIVAADRSGRRRGDRLVALTVPAALMAAALLAFNRLYFGSFLPNTFFVKADVAFEPLRGFSYVALFLHDYLLVLVLAVAAAGVWGALRAGVGSYDRPALVALVAALAVTLMWCAYVVRIGGGFMEFRFMAPVLPFLLYLLACAHRLAPSIRPFLVACLIVAGLHNVAIQWKQWQSLDEPFAYAREITRYPFYQIPRGAETVGQLRGHLRLPQDDWIGIGRTLERLFERRQDLLIATRAAGAIPYFSGLPTVDMLGLNDRRVAREGRTLASRPGHSVGATPEYLLERGVHLVFDHPLTVPRESLPGVLRQIPPVRLGVPRPPAGARLIALPINEHHAVIALYLKRHPAVEAVLARERFPVLELR